MQDTQAGESTPRSRGWLRPALFLVLVYLAAAVPVILFMGARGRAGEDQINYHEPAVHTFAAALPSPDLSDYLSATTPGYHLVLAAVERAISGDARVLQLAGAVFTVLLLLLLVRTVWSSCERNWLETLAICLPFACSMYVFQAGVWLLPDNAGWLFVLACLAVALGEPYGRRTIILGGLALIGIVLFRQVHFWVAGALWAAAWLAPGIDAPGGVRQLLTRLPARVRSLGVMLVASLPAVLLLAWFIRMWGGLTPPSFQGQYSGVNFAGYAFVLSLIGIGSLFFVFYLLDPLVDMVKARRRDAVLAALAGAGVAIIPATTLDVPGGRFSGLWAVAKWPVIAGHTSPVIVVCSALGAVMLLAWCRVVSLRDRWIVLGVWFGFSTAQVVSYQLWQRYSEPMVLMMLALMAARSRGICAGGTVTAKLLRPLRIGSVSMLALLLAALTAFTVFRSRPAAVYTPNHSQTPASAVP